MPYGWVGFLSDLKLHTASRPVRQLLQYRLHSKFIVALATTLAMATTSCDSWDPILDFYALSTTCLIDYD
eukprot:4495618-Amphidinium_carterae.2